jgi:hypothetical protein
MAVGQRDHTLDDVVETAQVHRQDLGPDRASRGQVAARDGAGLAQVLGDDEGQVQLVDQLGLGRVERVALPIPWR